jgi:hypothetical protein
MLVAVNKIDCIAALQVLGELNRTQSIRPEKPGHSSSKA